MMTESSSPGRNITTIQLLRGIAAVVVLFGHAQTEAQQMSHELLRRLPFAWGIGVDIFFVISGFIMVYSSRNLFGQPGAALEFMKRRIIRIVPLYYFYTAAMIAATLFFKDQLASAKFSPDMAFFSFLFFPYADSLGKMHPILGLGWTLNYEMFFYLLFACTIFMAESKALKSLAAIMLALAAIGFLFHPDTVALKFWTSSIILEFLFGCGLGYAFLRTRKTDDGFVFFLLLTFCAIAYVALAQGTTGRDVRFISWGLPSAVLVYAFVWHLPSRSERALEPIARWFGDSSYSLYLSHPFSLAIFKLAWRFPTDDVVFLWLYAVFASLFAVVVGYASHMLLEKPFLAYMKRQKELKRPA
ncbi:MAG: acyltransferase [Parvibaculum sp.]|uniref:acyltransferase family protein n=1 Tax=Parvibaculum sp. TaxID=2024848 RepID=UPI0025F5CF05|nr:acyltransferase [Parvibaculum sp.]MCE9649116.1 acyltransferase [Parvibaculum sp.]